MQQGAAMSYVLRLHYGEAFARHADDETIAYEIDGVLSMSQPDEVALKWLRELQAARASKINLADDPQADTYVEILGQR
jgi:hypothetical protein